MPNDSVQLAALGDSTRRRIFELVGARPRTVVELTRELTVSQSAVSQHLRVLRESRLVRAEPKGASNGYHIDPAGLGQMRALLHRLWSKNLAKYKTAVENSAKDEK